MIVKSFEISLGPGRLLVIMEGAEWDRGGMLDVLKVWVVVMLDVGCFEGLRRGCGGG